MTRDEFIDGYLSRSGMEKYRTEDGFQVPGTQRRYAMACACGDETCKGWAMVSEEGVETHLELYAPKGVRP